MVIIWCFQGFLGNLGQYWDFKVFFGLGLGLGGLELGLGLGLGG